MQIAESALGDRKNSHNGRAQIISSGVRTDEGRQIMRQHIDSYLRPLATLMHR
jgi:hypothetical protein